jgi:hypothetical protein
MLYVLIVVTNAYNGVTVSQQEYRGKDACEVAAIVVQQMAKDVKGWTSSNIETRCVIK